MKKEQQKIWFITGISSGLGKAIAESAMAHGDFVIGTFRNEHQISAFNQTFEGKACALKMDITNPSDIQNALQFVQQKFGKIDVLVNNAGFGFAGAIEEASLEEIRAVFETNFFGTLALTQAFLPTFRNQKGGHILQISSHGGFKAMAGFGIYNASKFALEGFSEALAAEISPLGIKLTIVEPGPFRTNFAGTSFQQAKNSIANYQQTAGVFREKIKSIDGKQEGNPQKAAEAIIQITYLENPPLRLPLGKIAIGTITSKLESVQKDLNDFKAMAESVVF